MDNAGTDIADAFKDLPMEKGALYALIGSAMTFILANSKNIFEGLQGLYQFVRGILSVLYKLKHTYDLVQSLETKVAELESVNTKQDELIRKILDVLDVQENEDEEITGLAPDEMALIMAFRGRKEWEK